MFVLVVRDGHKRPWIGDDHSAFRRNISSMISSER